MSLSLRLGIGLNAHNGSMLNLIPFYSDALFFLDGSITTVGSDKYFVDKKNGKNFLITGYDFTDALHGFPYKSAATISAPAADATLIAADINNFLYDAGGTPNAIPVVALYQDVDYEHKLFCRHVAQVLDGNGVETTEPHVIEVVLYGNVKSGDDLTECQTYYVVPAESGTALWVTAAGNDTTGNGSKATPWLTVDKAARTENSGKIVYAKTDDETYGATVDESKNNKINAIGLRRPTIPNGTYAIVFGTSANEWIGMAHTIGTVTNYSIYSTSQIIKFNRNVFTAGDKVIWLGSFGEIKNCILLHGNKAGSKVLYINAGTNTPVISGNLIKSTKAVGMTIISIETACGDFTISHNKIYPNTTGTIISNSGSSDDVLIIDNLFINTAFVTAFSHIGERYVTFNYNRFTGVQVGVVVALTTCKTIINDVKYNVCNYVNALISNTNSSINAVGNIVNSNSLSLSSNSIINCYVNADGAIAATHIKFNSLHNNRTGGYSILVGSDGYSAAGRDVVADIQIIGNRLINDATSGICHMITVGGQKNAIVTHNFIKSSGYGIGILGKDHNCDDADSFIGYNVVKNHGYGIYMFGTVVGDGIRIFNNTVFNDAAFIYGIAIDAISGGVDPNNCTIKNNIVICLGTGTIPMVSCGGTGNVFDYNLYYCPNGTPTFNGGTFAAWQAGGQDAHSRFLTDEEFAGLFTDYANDDFSLKAGSAAIGAGTDLGTNFDDGLDKTASFGSDAAYPVIVTKQQGAAWDCGAYVH